MRRVLIGLLMTVVVLVGLLALLAGSIVDGGFVHARVLAAIERATGHAARIDGRIELAWSLAPTLSVERAVLLNPPGFSRPAFALARRVDVRVGVWPLLFGRVEVPAVVVDGADVLLERDAAGRGNWLPPAAPASTPSGPSRPHTPVEVGQVRIMDGRLAYRGLGDLAIASLSFVPAGGAVEGQVALNGAKLSVSGTTDPPVGGETPFVLKVMGEGLTATAAGPFKAGPVLFQVTSPDLAATPALARYGLPPLRDVVLNGEAWPGGLRSLDLTAGESALGDRLPASVRLVRLSATMAALDQPVKILAQVLAGSLPVAVAVTVAPRSGPDGALPIQTFLAADGGTLQVEGALMGEQRFEGTIAARAPDLARSGALAGLSLPRLHDAAFGVRVRGSASAVLLRGLRFASAEGDLAGDLALEFAPRLSVRGSLVSKRFVLDAWTPLLAPAAPPSPSPAPAPPSSAPPSSAPPRPAPSNPAPAWLIPERPLPFSALRRADADVRASAGEVVFNGATYRSAELRILLQDGRLRLDPASAVVSGSRVQGVLQADAGAEPPTVAVALRGLGLDAAGLSAAAGAGGAVTGTVDVDLDVHATGMTAHAMASSMSGRLAVALADGEVENGALAAMFGSALQQAGVPFEVAGRSRVRCLAVRADVTQGEANVQSVVLDASRLRIEGEGEVNLGAGTMDMHLRPEIRLGPFPVKVPLHIVGPWRNPQKQAEKGVVAPNRFGISIGAPSPDPCGPALAAMQQELAR